MLLTESDSSEREFFGTRRRISEFPDFRSIALEALEASATRRVQNARRRAEELERLADAFRRGRAALDHQVRPVLEEAVSVFAALEIPAVVVDNFHSPAGTLPAWLAFYCEESVPPGTARLAAASDRAFFTHDGQTMRFGSAKSYRDHPERTEPWHLSNDGLCEIVQAVLISYLRSLERRCDRTE
jgi:hypothetical protein